MKQRPDDLERDNSGPLFSPRLRSLSHQNDPYTSVKAAARMQRFGTAQNDAEWLVYLIELFPGQTMEWYGNETSCRLGGDPYRWRLKLGRRTGTLKDAGLIHQDGERDGMSCWWPGRRA